MIESNIEVSAPKVAKYPYLGKRRDFNMVVLFVKKGTGFVVFDETDGWTIGEDHGGWDESEFDHFQGNITLNNK